jgi:predicted ribosome quality control (RQC) complex YloA/Tae2 family protein
MERKLSTFDIYVIVSEMQDLVGSYIDNIYQLTRDELLIRVAHNKTKQKESIFIRNGDLICLTKKQFEAPLKPTNFAMTLRKYLLNGKITRVTQQEFDRIINLKIGKKEGEYTLVIEFFSKGNIILVNPDGKIITPLISQTWAHRTIKTHEIYSPPPAQINPLNLTFENFSDLLKKSKADLVRTLAVPINLGGPIAEEICVRANIDKNASIKDLDEKKIERIFSTLSSFLKIFKNKEFQPVLIKQDGKPIDILPFEFKSYEKQDFEKIDSFARGLQEFTGIKKIKKQETSGVNKKIEKLKRQLTQQQEFVVELKKNINQKKLEGDLIYLNFQLCESLLNEITAILQHKEKDDEIQKINDKEIVKEFDPQENRLVVLLKDTNGKVSEVDLDFRKSVTENATNAYDDSKKLRNKLVGAQESIEKTKDMIESVEKEDVKEGIGKEKSAEAKTFWFERFRWFISSDGNIIVAGKDAKNNEQVVKKYLKEGDRYAHADIHGAPSCVIKNKDMDGKDTPISEITLNEACQFAAGYSKAWKQFAEAQAYWVLPEQVSRTPQSGEFLPKGAFVIRGKRNYYKCKLELAVGQIMIEDTKKIMGGPVDAVKKRSDKYVVIVPGDMKRNVLAHKLSKVFDMPADQIEKVLPPGDVTVIEKSGFELK